MNIYTVTYRKNDYGTDEGVCSIAANNVAGAIETTRKHLRVQTYRNDQEIRSVVFYSKIDRVQK